MTHPTEIDLLNAYLRRKLPQEWLISKSEHINCEGTNVITRVDSEIKAENERELVCLIEVKPDEIIIRTPNMQTKKVQKVTQMIKLYCTASENYCLTLTECPLNCETCINAWSKFNDSIPQSNSAPSITCK